GVDNFKIHIVHLEENQSKTRAKTRVISTALRIHDEPSPRQRVPAMNGEASEESTFVMASILEYEEVGNGGGYSAHNLVKSVSMICSTCTGHYR
ncbi:hypothetical protein HID58_048134, partial [Brassica napus]